MKRLLLWSTLSFFSLQGYCASGFSPLSDIETSGASSHHWHGYVNWTSDYVYRAISLSNSAPARQGAIDYRNDNGVFAGWWVSTMEFAPPVGPNTEHNVYIGHGVRWNDSWRSELSATHFDFRGGTVGPDNTFTQWQLATTHASGGAARVYYAKNSYGMRFSSVAAELEYPYALSTHWSINGMLGYWDLENFVGKSYYYSDIALRYQQRNFSAAIHHHAATKAAEETYGEAADSGWLAMFAIGF